jgi:hypothetical protein
VLWLRLLFGALFVGGYFFAALAWFLVPTPIGIFQPEYQYTVRDTLMSLTGCGLALTGYFLWANWLSFAVRGKFVPNNGTLIQIVSFANHLGWLVFFPFLKETNFLEFLTGSPLIAFWIFVNLVVACITGLIFATAPKYVDAQSTS